MSRNVRRGRYGAEALTESGADHIAHRSGLPQDVNPC